MKESPFSIEILRKCKEIKPNLEKEREKYLFLFNEILYFDCIVEETVKLYQTAFLIMFSERLASIASIMKPHVNEFFKKHSKNKEEDKEREEETYFPDMLMTKSLNLPKKYSTFWDWEFDVMENGPKYHRIHFFFKEWEIQDITVSEHYHIPADYKVEFPDIIEN